MITKIEQPPHIAYKYLLDKGENLTASEIVYLRNKEVSIKRLMKVTGLDREAVHSILNHADKYIENHKKGAMEMGKFTLTQAEYNDHKAQGKTDSEIAKANGVSSAGLKYHKDKWKRANKAKGVEVLREKSLNLKTEPSEEHKQAMNELKEKLDYSERVNEGLKRNHENLKEQYNSVVAEYEKQHETIGRLEMRVFELEEEVNNLQAIADYTEKEVAASQEYIEREQELMVDANVWKQKAMQYEAEYKRQTDTLKEERAEKEKYKGESLAFRLALKAVL